VGSNADPNHHGVWVVRGPSDDREPSQDWSRELCSVGPC
jgi:hypothetical protein